MDKPQFWSDALQQGGALTVFESALQSSSGFEQVLRQAAGPGLGLVGDVYNLGPQNLAQAIQGKDTHFGREASRLAERYAPGTNLWPSRLLMQRLFWNNLQRVLDPDAEESFRRQEDALKRIGSSGYWWHPGDALPGGSGPAPVAHQGGLERMLHGRDLQRELGIP